jgi:hypothetical protein
MERQTYCAPRHARRQHCTIHSRIVTAFWQKHVSKRGGTMAFSATAAKAIPAGAAVFLLLIGPGARAQQPSQDQIAAIRASCRSDFMANCSGVTPGGKDALECLKRNLANLSGSCKTAVSAITPAPAPPATAGVAPPAPSPSAAVTPPASSSVKPAAAAKPTPHPTAKLAPAPPAAAAGPATATAAPPPSGAPETPHVIVLPPREALRIVRICAADQQALCAGVPPGGGRIIACLMRNRAALSPLCKNALAMAQSR